MKPGSIIMCIDDRFHADAGHIFSSLPKKNVLYVVREIIPNYEVCDGPPGVALEGIFGRGIILITNQGLEFTVEAHFKMARFREIIPADSRVAVHVLSSPEPEFELA